MTKTQYELSEKLKQDKHIHVKLLAMKKQYEELRNDDMVSAISYESDGSTPQPNGNSTENKYIKRDEQLNDIRKDINNLQNQLSEPMKWKRKLFANLTDSVMYGIMSMLYISFLTIDETAQLVPCDTTTVCRKRNKALDILNNIAIECNT